MNRFRGSKSCLKLCPFLQWLLSKEEEQLLSFKGSFHQLNMTETLYLMVIKSSNTLLSALKTWNWKPPIYFSQQNINFQRKERLPVAHIAHLKGTIVKNPCLLSTKNILTVYISSNKYFQVTESFDKLFLSMALCRWNICFLWFCFDYWSFRNLCQAFWDTFQLATLTFFIFYNYDTLQYHLNVRHCQNPLFNPVKVSRHTQTACCTANRNIDTRKILHQCLRFLGHIIRKHLYWLMQPAKNKISLRTHAVWSE